MEIGKKWIQFNERVLKFKYPPVVGDTTFSTFFKKVFVDCFLFDLAIAVVLFVVLDPLSHSENLQAYFRILGICIGIGILFEAIYVVTAKLLRKRN